MSTIRHLPPLMRRLGIRPLGVVHVGAHLGQEIPIYREAGFDRIVMVEANPELAARIPTDGVKVHVAACGRTSEGFATLHITPNDQQSSILVPGKKPVVRKVQVLARRLADLQHGCNVAVVDVQGAELEVMAGADLDGLDLVVLEASIVARYVGGATLATVVEYMTRLGWTEVARWDHGERRPARITDLVFRRPSS